MSVSPLIADIILIGPIRSGKTTMGRLLAEKLDVPQITMDELCWDYYKEIGFDEPETEVNGPDGMIASRFHLHAFERLLAEHRECVIDLGAGHSVHREEADLKRMQEALTAYPNVFLLLPSPDLDASAAILAERNVKNNWLQAFTEESGWNPNEYFLRHPSNFTLARHIVYTEGKTPEETRDEILKLVEPKLRKRGRHARSRRKSEIIAKLTAALHAAEESSLRSIVLITAQKDGGGECWARISDEDQTTTCNYLAALRQDMKCP